MTLRIQLILIAEMLLIAGSSVAEPEMTKDAGWYKDRDTVLAEVSTVAILPTDVRIETPNAEEACKLIEAQIAAMVAEVGMEVLPAGAFRELLNDTKVALGGYYDPYTGEVIKEKYRSIADLTKREFERLHDFQAYFRPSIRVRTASFTEGTASWDGVDEKVNVNVGLFQALGSLGNVTYGKVPSASLIGILYSPDKTTYYAQAGGIQLLKVLEKGRFVPVAPELLLSDEAKLSMAVDLAIDPFLTPITAKALKRQQKIERRQRREAKKREEARQREEAKHGKGARRNKRDEKRSKTTDVSAASELRLNAAAHDARNGAFLSEIKTVALLPLTGAQFKGRDDVPEFVEEMLRDELLDYDINTVPGELYQTLWNEKLLELGGIYDPITGKKLDGNAHQIRQYARQGVESQHQVDAYLIPTLVVKDVHYTNVVAKWDGVREKTWGPKGPGLTGVVDGNALHGLSLVIRLETPDGVEIYTGEGGWQLLEKFTKKGRKAILPADLFRDEERNRMAVHFALRPLLLDYETFSTDVTTTKRRGRRD